MQQDPATSATGPSPEELSLLARAFASTVSRDDVRALLEYLNGRTVHRFTGVYRFEPGWVVSVALWDRLDPTLRIGADVKMKESYCSLTGLGDSSYVIEDAMNDCRLEGHAAQTAVRSYVAVLLRDKHGAPWGTLCHFDYDPRRASQESISYLDAFRPLIEEILVRDHDAAWAPEAPSVPRIVS